MSSNVTFVERGIEDCDANALVDGCHELYNSEFVLIIIGSLPDTVVDIPLGFSPKSVAGKTSSNA